MSRRSAAAAAAVAAVTQHRNVSRAAARPSGAMLVMLTKENPRWVRPWSAAVGRKRHRRGASACAAGSMARLTSSAVTIAAAWLRNRAPRATPSVAQSMLAAREQAMVTGARGHLCGQQPGVARGEQQGLRDGLVLELAAADEGAEGEGERVGGGRGDEQLVLQRRGAFRALGWEPGDDEERHADRGEDEHVGGADGEYLDQFGSDQPVHRGSPSVSSKKMSSRLCVGWAGVAAGRARLVRVCSGAAATMRPLLMSTMSSAMRATSSSMWLETSTVPPLAANPRSRSRSQRTPGGSRPLAGSSRIRIRGCPSRAAARPRRRRMPLE